MTTDERDIKQEAIDNLRNQAAITINLDEQKLLLDSADRLEREIMEGMSKFKMIVTCRSHNPVIW
jgi:hypothetical protein